MFTISTAHSRVVRNQKFIITLEGSPEAVVPIARPNPAMASLHFFTLYVRLQTTADLSPREDRSADRAVFCRDQVGVYIIVLSRETERRRGCILESLASPVHAYNLHTLKLSLVSALSSHSSSTL